MCSYVHNQATVCIYRSYAICGHKTFTKIIITQATYWTHVHCTHRPFPTTSDFCHKYILISGTWRHVSGIIELTQHPILQVKVIYYSYGAGWNTIPWTTFPTNLYFLYFLKVETEHTKQAAWLSLAVTFSSFHKGSPPPQLTTHQEQNDYISLCPLLEVT